VFRYRNRADAGAHLAESLAAYAGSPAVLVLGLPRGGIPVAFEAATRLRAPLDAYVVRKLGVPGHEELAMGAVAGDGTVVLDDRLIAALGISEDQFDDVVRRELDEVHRREEAYRNGRPEPEVSGKTVIVIDDGLATGSTMRAAAMALRRNAPASIVIAVPTAAARTCEELKSVADEVVCPYTPEPFYAVGLYYDDFRQTTDDEVRSLLRRANVLEARRWRASLSRRPNRV
jgi:putative phosphoribosyl transferase